MDLHSMLCEVLNAPFPDGYDHCYFEPPSNTQIFYPCIIYNYINDKDEYADNVIYRSFKRYKVTVIDADPDSKIPERMKSLPYCSSDRNYTSDGLKHFVYTLYHRGPRIKKEVEE